MKLTILSLLAVASVASAAIPESQAIAAIIGEAGGEPIEAQIAVGETIRARGSLRGIYGVNNPCVAKASTLTKERAKAAWRLSASSHLSNGAKYFGGEMDAKYFAKLGVKQVAKYGKVTFYK